MLTISQTNGIIARSFDSLLYIYPMDFKMHRDGKGANPREHSQLCDWGE